MSTRPRVVRNVYFIKQNDHGVWVSGIIISDSSVYVVSMAEDDNVRVFAIVVYHVDDSDFNVHNITRSGLCLPVFTAICQEQLSKNADTAACVYLP